MDRNRYDAAVARLAAAQAEALAARTEMRQSFQNEAENVVQRLNNVLTNAQLTGPYHFDTIATTPLVLVYGTAYDGPRFEVGVDEEGKLYIVT